MERESEREGERPLLQTERERESEREGERPLLQTERERVRERLCLYICIFQQNIILLIIANLYVTFHQHIMGYMKKLFKFY